MNEILRTITVEETEKLYRLLEFCFGHGWGYFPRWYPERYSKDETSASCSLIVEAGGEIVSHVGVFPMEIVAGPARLMCGGIGGVATLPEARGHGYMSRLLKAAIQRMREKGWPLSVLWGDRQRYGSFGYETAGWQYRLMLNRRSLERSGVKPVVLAEVNPTAPETAVKVRELYAQSVYRVERPQLEQQLRRTGIRIFLGPDGYLLSRPEVGGDVEILELISPTHKEGGLVLSVLNRTHGNQAMIVMTGGEEEKVKNLLSAASTWQVEPLGMLRINLWRELLSALRPLLALKASGLPPFKITIGCAWEGEVEKATVAWDGMKLGIEPGQEGTDYVEVDERLLVAWVFGGPHPGRESLGLFGKLLPVPLYIPPFDYV